MYQSEKTVKRILSEAANQFKQLTEQEKILDAKGLSLKFLIQKENEKLNFMSRLRHIKTNMAAPLHLQLAIKLLSEKRYCNKLRCYQNSKFNVGQDGRVTIDTVVTTVKLLPHIHTSCQLLKLGRTSIFHNELFQVKNGCLVPNNPSLPRDMTILDLHNSNVDSLTRKIMQSDLLQGTVFPIFNLQKISFMCIQPTLLLIDNVQTHCDLTSVSFIEYPELIMLNEKIIWSKSHNIETDFLQKKLKWEFPSLNPLITDHNVFSSKLHEHHPLDRLVNYFTDIDTVSISLIGTLAGMTVLFLIIMAVLAIYCCPTVVSRMCCCASRTNCLATILNGRKRANTEFKKWKVYTAAAKQAAAEAAQTFLQGHAQPHQDHQQQPTAPTLDQERQPLQAPVYSHLRQTEPEV